MLNRYRLVLFRPVTVLAISLLVSLFFIGPSYFLTRGALRELLLFYFVPICVPFVAFLFDRAARWNEIKAAQWLVEVPVIFFAILRALVSVPFISGHALFLSYALITSRSWVAKITTLIVYLEVAFLKIIMWKDTTFIWGTLIGLLAGIYVVFIIEKPKPQKI